MSVEKVSQLTKPAARLSVCLPFRLLVCKVLPLSLCSVPDDLSPEERQELECIRRRKEELLLDIQVTSVPTALVSLHQCDSRKAQQIVLSTSMALKDKNGPASL